MSLRALLGLVLVASSVNASEPLFSPNPRPSNPDYSSAPFCGDAVVNGSESCDDGNASNGDGCTSACLIEPKFTCVGSPSVCTNVQTARANTKGLTPVWNIHPGSGSGLANLTPNVFGATTMTTVIEMKGQTATDSNWPATTGGTFTYPDGGVDTDAGVRYRAPTTAATEASVDFDRFYRAQAPTTSLGEVGAGVDAVLTVVFFTIARGATQQVAGKFKTADNTGYKAEVSSGDVLRGNVNGTTFGSYALDALGQWNMIQMSMDSGAVNGCRMYVNAGGLSGSAANCPADLTTSSAINFAVGGRATGVNQDGIEGKVAFVKLETCNACITSTADQDAQALKHALEYYGATPVAGTVLTPDTSLLRDSPRVMCIERDNDGLTMCFRVGNKWITTIRRPLERYGDHVTLRNGKRTVGYNPNGQATNIALNNTDVTNATYSKLDAGDTVTDGVYESPLVNQSTVGQLASQGGSRLTCSATNGPHGESFSATLAASTTYTYSVVFYRDATSTTGTHGWLEDTTLGATTTTYFHLDSCMPSSIGTGLHTPVGNVFTASANTYDYGTLTNVHRCRAMIRIDSVGAGAHTFKFGISKTNGTVTTSCNGELLGGFALPQIEAIGDGEKMTSFILTDATSKTRNLDVLGFANTDVPRQHMMSWSAQIPDSRCEPQGSAFCGPSTYVCQNFKDLNNNQLLKITQGAGQGVIEGTGVNASGSGYFGAVLNGGANLLDAIGGGSPPGQFYAPKRTPYDGNYHTCRLVAFDNDIRGYCDGDSLAGVSSTSGTQPTTTGGMIYVGVGIESGSHQSDTVIDDCSFWAAETIPLYP